MNVLGIILARAGSRGLPNKCVVPLLGRPLIDYTIDHALASDRMSAVVLTTDSAAARAVAIQRDVVVIDRPDALATDTAKVDDAARHAVTWWQNSSGGFVVDAVVLMYANIPIRRNCIIDQAIDLLVSSGADSVRTVAPVSKQHPDWIHRLDGDRMQQYRPNGIYRRQDLEPLYFHDGAVVAVRCTSLFAAADVHNDGQAFLGSDRRAVICACDDAVDVDNPHDLHVASAILNARRETTTI